MSCLRKTKKKYDQKHSFHNFEELVSRLTLKELSETVFSFAHAQT